MIDYKKETTKMIAKSSKAIAQLVASESFEFWQRKDFRLYVEFDNLDQTEQDRMFNEFEVSVIGLFIFKFRDAAFGKDKEKQIVFKALEKDLPLAFLQLFIDLGIEQKHIELWRELIKMRLKEYEGHLKVSLEESKKWPELKNEPEDLKKAWARIETITIDCLTHIRRGKVEEGDSLWKLIRKWLLTVDAKLTPIASL